MFILRHYSDYLENNVATVSDEPSQNSVHVRKAYVYRYSSIYLAPGGVALIAFYNDHCHVHHLVWG